MRNSVCRVGDMHPNRLLRVTVQNDQDIVLTIEQDGEPIGDIELGNPRDRSAHIEFCLSGGRSKHTRAALFALTEAIRKDNEESPIEQE